MDFAQIRPVALFIAAFLHCIFAYLIWFRSKNKDSYYLGWMALFSAIASFAWAGVFFFQENKLFWVKSTWLFVLVATANIIFTYYFTGRTKFFKLKIIIWYSFAAILCLTSLITPYIIGEVSNQYPFITFKTAGPLNQLARFFAMFFILVPLYYLFNFYRQSTGYKKIQIKYFIAGNIIYLIGGFLFNGILPFYFMKNFIPI